MSQDIVADGLNEIMNARRAGKRELKISQWSKVLLNIFEMMKKADYIDYEVNEEERKVVVKILKLNKCRAVKPRYFVAVEDIDKYLRRFLPSRNFGVLVISTSKGLMTHDGAYENKIGGAVIAYFY